MITSAQSSNRANVALSRAKHGLFILGNSDDLKTSSRMWGGVIDELEAIDCLGKELPVTCHRHPENVAMVAAPGQLPEVAPDGESNNY